MIQIVHRMQSKAVWSAYRAHNPSVVGSNPTFAMNIKNYFVTFCDAAEPWQYGIQDFATPNMEGMIFFHNYLVFFYMIYSVCSFLAII
jgi:hypothetical protein